MPPKRKKTCSTRVDPVDLTPFWTAAANRHKEGLVTFGDYMMKKTIDVEVLESWHGELPEVLKVIPNLVLNWECAKHSLLSFFTKHPRADPFLKSDKHDTVMSAEVVASGFKGMLSNLRRCAMSEDKASALLKNSAPEPLRSSRTFWRRARKMWPISI